MNQPVLAGVRPVFRAIAATIVPEASRLDEGRWSELERSLFPDSLEINPYVTIMALADRVAEGVRRDAAALLAA